jgi:hypothetical protein
VTTTAAEPQKLQVLSTLRETAAAVELHGIELDTLPRLVSYLRRRMNAVEGSKSMVRRVETLERRIAG